MPVQLKEEHDGRILAVNVSGKLIKADYARITPEFERLVQPRGTPSRAA
jgi:hypothetical protein